MLEIRKILALAAAITAVAGVLPACAETGISRYPADKFPISTVVEVPPGASTLYLSGMGAPVSDTKADPHSTAAYGDTQAQTHATLERIEGVLKARGLGLGDVVQMHIFMAPDPKLGKIDFDGMMKAYTRFYGTATQPNLPVRSAFGVAQLANPGWLVEIEVIAARAPGK